ncbi:tetratricopeptide repeat protein [Sphingosinicella rhizophila]|uniref:Uncharacterized protein n=1 Tax=Sphingosinicella rhizophila TaxID=3050082 RepID=A0ABU3Q8G5_9SPHN|nr:hypothetical protein [Sphingosinicella sp. GR2756]MDT9599700.1 hypothetical protein [Sphingosinicella sp. GR2756]
MRARLQGLSAGRAGKTLLLVIGAIFMAWLVFKTSAVDGLLRARPNAAARVAPDDPRPVMEVAMQEFRRRNGTLSRVKSTRAINAISGAPLAEEPFLLAGLIARVNGDAARGERLLAEARRRNPRSRTARLVLLDGYLQSNQVAAASAEIRVLNALVPQVATVLVPELARMVRNPRTRPAMMRVLEGDAIMRQSVLEQLASSGADPDLILRIAQTDRASGSARAAPWQGLLIQKLIDKGDVRRAHRLWQSFIGARETQDAKSVYDGSFKGLPGAAPFNWKLTQGTAGVAEPARSGGLEVAFYGRLPTELASQMLMLRPGRYRLQFRVEGSAKGEGSRLVWVVACHKAKSPLLELPLKNISYATRRIVADFNVPASGCPAQWLRLSGINGEFATAQNVTIGEVEIRKAGKS